MSNPWDDDPDVEAAPESANPWDDDPDVNDEEGFGKTAGAVAAGAVSGALEGSGMVAGGALGAAAGSAVLPGVGTVVGGLVGAGVGMWAGNRAKGALINVEVPGLGVLAYDSPSQIPEKQRPWYNAGETFTSSLALGVGTVGAIAATGYRFSQTLGNGITDRIGNYAAGAMNAIIESATASPLAFAMAETSMALSSSMGAYYAESFFPGSTGARIGSEMAFGLANPTRLMMAGLEKASALMLPQLRATKAASEPGSVAELLLKNYEAHGGDPEKLKASLLSNEGKVFTRNEAGEMVEMPLTVAQKTGDPIFAAMEAQIRAASDTFGAQSSKQAAAALDVLKIQVQMLRGTGDPEMLRIAAQLEKEQFDTLLSANAKIASQATIDAALKIDPANPADLAGYGKKAYDVMDGALSSARTAERQLYEKVDKALPAMADNIVKQFDTLTADMLPERVKQLPSLLTEAVERLRNAQSAAQDGVLSGASDAAEYSTTGELMQLRNEFLSQARSATAKGDFADARIFNRMADAVLDDLAPLETASVPLATARAWSEKLHDTFTRTFVGDALAVDRTGADRIYPEELMKKAFGSGKELGDLQFKQLDQAAKMGDESYTKTAEAILDAQDSFYTRIADAQTGTLKYLAARVVDRGTGEVNEAALKAFKRDNRALLERFPEIGERLDDVVSAKRLLDDTAGAATKAKKDFENKATFKLLTDGVEPTKVVGDALLSNNPSKAMQELVALAEQGGQPAKDGLKKAVQDVLFDNAGGAENFSWAKYGAFLENPVYPGGPKGAKVLRDAGIMSPEELLVTRQFVSKAGEIEAAEAAGRNVQEVDFGAGEGLRAMVTGLALKAVHAVNSQVPVTTANSLWVTSQVSRATRKFLNQIVGEKKLDAAQALLADYKVMEAALKTGKINTPEKAAKYSRVMNGWLMNAGIEGWREDDQD